MFVKELKQHLLTIKNLRMEEWAHAFLMMVSTAGGGLLAHLALVLTSSKSIVEPVSVTSPKENMWEHSTSLTIIMGLLMLS